MSKQLDKMYEGILIKIPTISKEAMDEMRELNKATLTLPPPTECKECNGWGRIEYWVKGVLDYSCPCEVCKQQIYINK